MNEEEISIKERELVIKRLELVSAELHFSDGSNAEAYSRDGMIKLINEDHEVGKEFVRTELEFLRALKDGRLIERLSNPS